MGAQYYARFLGPCYTDAGLFCALFDIFTCMRRSNVTEEVKMMQKRTFATEQ